MSSSLPLWVQIVAIIVSPVLALIGVGVGARMSRSGEERKWLRDARLRAYTAYLSACNSYDVAARQLGQSLRTGPGQDQSAARADALRAIRDVLTCQESVLLLGSAQVQAGCAAATKAVYAMNDSTRRLIEGADDGGWPDAGEGLRQAVQSFREAVRSELLSQRRGMS
jgi:hypothetical protein